MALLVLWVGNNSYWNARYVRLTQKLLTLVLVFKTLCVYASFSLFMSCPFDKVSFGLLQLGKNQFRTLYETSFLCLLLVLSKGLFLTRTEFTRSEFNYISVLASVSYVTVSADNVLSAQASLVLGALYFTVWGHCLVFSYIVWGDLKEQIRATERQEMREMSAVWRVKRTRFGLLCIGTQVYLLGSLVVNFAVKDWSFGLASNYYSVSAAKVVAIETLEFCTFSLIFAIYRAKPELRLFSLISTGSPFRFPNLYHTSLFEAGQTVPLGPHFPVLIRNPGEEWNEKYPFQQVTLGLVAVSRSSEPRRKPTQIEMADSSLSSRG